MELKINLDDSLKKAIAESIIFEQANAETLTDTINSKLRFKVLKIKSNNQEITVGAEFKE